MEARDGVAAEAAGRSSRSAPTDRMPPGASAENDWVNRRLRTAGPSLPSSISQTPFRVSPVDAGPRVEDPGVPEVDDVDAASDAADQRVLVAIAGPDDGAGTERAERSAALDRVARAAGVATSGLRGPARVKNRVGDAALDDADRPSGRALDIEPEADHAQVGDVVAGEIDRSNCCSPRRTNDRPSSTTLRVEPVDEQEREQVRDGSLAEDHLVPTGIEVDRVAGGPRPSRLASAAAPSTSASRADVRRRRQRWRSSRSRRSSPRSARPLAAWPALFANAASIAAVEQAPASRGRRPRRRMPGRGSPGRPGRGGGRLVPVVDGDTAGRRRRARPAVVAGATRAAAMTLSTSRPSVSSSVGPSRLVLAVRPSSSRGRTWLISSATFWWMKLVAKRVSAVVPNRTVTCSRPRCPGRSRTIARTRSAASRPCRSRQSSRHPDADLAEAGRHRRTLCGRSAAAGPCRSSACPRTSTRRARRACPSSPEARADARVRRFAEHRPRLPFLISQPISQPNWKFHRLSSIDQERLVSIRIPSSVAAIISSSELSPGSPTFVMRTIGRRLKPSARTAPPERPMPASAADRGR